MAVFLNSFIPLAYNRFGRESAKRNNLPLFIDGSCRREPDFQNPLPAITQLCRPGKLVTRLNVGDLVIYITKLGKYSKSTPHWNFIGILEVIDLAQDHIQAETYYNNKEIKVSQNIICNQTKAFPLDMTHGKSGFNHRSLPSQRIISIWNCCYVKRANDYPMVAITKVWDGNLNLTDPPEITREMIMNIFKRVPGTQTPPEISDREWIRFQEVILNNR